jgi:hypothetical protein
MNSGPSKAAEAIVAVFVPPACREEVLGDLHERYQSPRQYALDAVRAVPLVILSRVRRTADPPVLLIQAFALYVSFLGAAWFNGGALLFERPGLLRLAVPAGTAMLGLVLEDAYANPGRQSPLSQVRGPMVGLGVALLSQGVFWAGNSSLAIPGWTMLYGCAMSLLLCSAVRMSFPPTSGQLQGANAPAVGPTRARGSGGNPQTIVRVVQGITAIVAVAIVGTWMADYSVLPKRLAFNLLVGLLIAYTFYQLRKRG